MIKQFLNISVIILCFWGQVKGEVPSEEKAKALITGYIKNELSPQDAMDFAIEAALNYEETLERVVALKYAEDESFSSKDLNLAVERLKDSNQAAGSLDAETEKDQDEIHWMYYLYLVEGDISARPLVKLIGEDSPAFKAGLRQGDVITHVAKRDISHVETVLVMRRLMKLWPETAPLPLKLLRNKYNHRRPTDASVKSKVVHVKVPAKK